MADRNKFAGRQKIFSEFGEFVLANDDIDLILNEACRLVANALDCSLAKVIEIERESDTALVRAGVGWHKGIVGSTRISLTERSSEAYAIQKAEPIITNDIALETRFDFPGFLHQHGVVALVNVPIFLPGRIPYGILQVDAQTPREFDHEDINFLRAYAMVLGPVIDRLNLAKQRRETDALIAADLNAMRTLQRVSSELVGEHHPQTHYDRIVEAAGSLMRADAASLQALDARTGRLKLIAWQGFHPDSAQFWEWVSADTGSSCGRALELGQRIVVPDLDLFVAEPDNVEAFRRSNLLSVQSTPLRAFSGQVVGMLSTHWRDRRQPNPNEYRHFDVLARLSADLIERVQAAEKLRDSEKRLAAAFESVPVGVAVIDVTGASVLSNAEYRRFVPTDIIPSRDPAAAVQWQAWDQERRPIASTNFPSIRALRGERVLPGLEMLFTDARGSKTWTTVASVPIRDAEGRVTGAATAISDIDSAKRNSEALRVSEERLRQFGDASQDVLWIRDADKLQWQYLTPAFESIYGLDREEALRGDNFHGWLDLIVQEDRD